MKLELRIGKVSTEFVKGDRKETVTLEDINVSVEVAAGEIVETVKAIAEAVKDECQKASEVSEAPTVVEEIVAMAAEEVESKNEQAFNLSITINFIDLKAGRSQVEVMVDDVQYMVFTNHYDAVTSAAIGSLRDAQLNAFAEDATVFRSSVSGVRKLDYAGKCEFIDMVNRYSRFVTVK